MYGLTFYEAIDKCMNGEGYIRGERFKNGVYVKLQGDQLIAVDGLRSNKIIGSLYIGRGIMNQKFKLFNNLTTDELMDGYTI